ncbi:hypothetical protein [uncultured Schumannella sp.]|jgi:hypothetical protein|uniref:hypothetical protein n=1 Tax=uncultured Schumannella sp. TaxID=1195956 RepID=UPI0025F0AD7C|nr:hypothetical protein [uncultured Schumannella sp.]
MPSQSRRRAADPRLFIGLVLVAVSVLGVVGIVSAFDQRSSVYAAGVALQPGDRIVAADLVERRVDLDGGEGLYLAVGQLPEEGLVVTEAIRAGELVGVSALGDASAVGSTALVLTLAAPVSSSLEPGSRVDVWMAAAVTDGLAAPPAVLVADAVLVEVRENDGFISSADGASVEVLVPRARVARILQAIADDLDLAVVPAGLAWTAP